jgi:hypothetical protein
VESHEFGKRDVHVDDVDHIPLDEPAQVAAEIGIFVRSNDQLPRIEANRI